MAWHSCANVSQVPQATSLTCQMVVVARNSVLVAPDSFCTLRPATGLVNFTNSVSPIMHSSTVECASCCQAVTNFYLLESFTCKNPSCCHE